MRKYPTDWSAHWIAFTTIDPATEQDLWVLESDGAAKPCLQTEFSESDGRLSPDERWMAYTSNEAGHNAIYIRPFPDANGGKWRVSGVSAGMAPRWRADGNELFYVDDSGRMMAVAVKLGDQAPQLGAPQALFKIDGLTRAQYRVSRDGTRFLIPLQSAVGPAEAPLSVILNWPTLVRRD